MGYFYQSCHEGGKGSPEWIDVSCHYPSDKQGTQHSPLGRASLECATRVKYGSDTGERDAEKTYLEGSKAIEKLGLFLYPSIKIILESLSLQSFISLVLCPSLASVL